MIITISGMPGSGKNTVADILAKELNLKRYSVGNYRREMAKERNMTLEELNRLGEKNEFTDRDADEWQKKIAKTQDNFIIDGRLSWHFIPDSVKIFLDVKPEIGAERIMLDKRQEETAKTEKQAVKLWKDRLKSDIKRYKKYYNLNPYNKKNYDFVLDTSKLNIEQATAKVLWFIKKGK